MVQHATKSASLLQVTMTAAPVQAAALTLAFLDATMQQLVHVYSPSHLLVRAHAPPGSQKRIFSEINAVIVCIKFFLLIA